MSTTQADDDTTETVTKAEFLSKPRWVCWRYDGDDKPPLQPWDDGPTKASTTDATTWGTLIEANEYHTREDTDTEGVGYVLGSDDSIAAIDCDDCYDPATGNIEPWAADIIQTIDSYTEISPSGYGIRIWLIGSLPDGASNKHPQERTLDELSNRDTPALEVYDANQYLTFTRDYCELGADTLNERDNELTQVYDAYATHSSQKSTQDRETTANESAGNTSQSSVTLADDDILELARDASNSTRFRELWHNRDGDNPSNGDFSLCLMLAFYTRNHAQIDRLFRQSDRLRDKWDAVHYASGETYGEHTIDEALTEQTQQYTRTTDSNSNSEDTGGVSETAPDSTANSTATATADSTTDGNCTARGTPPTHVVDLPECATPTEPATATETCECGIEITVTVHTTIPQHVAYDRVKDTLIDTIDTGTPTLVDGICSVGKSYGSLLAAMETDAPVTILAPRHDIFNQYTTDAEEQGYDEHEHHVLPSFPNDCPTMNGEYGEEWQNRFETLYAKESSPTEIHSKCMEMFGEKPPCDDGQECKYKRGWDYDDDATQVLIGHYSHAFVPSVTENRTVFIDEYPTDDYIDEFSQKQVTRYVNNFLDRSDNPHFNNISDLLENRTFGVPHPTHERCKEWFDRYDIDSSSNTVIDSVIENGYSSDETENIHRMAPILTYGILTAEKCDADSRYEHTEFDAPLNGDMAHFRFARNRETHEVRLLRTPPFDGANTVIGLDGTPEPELWRDTFDIDFDHEQVLTDEERREYIRDTLGLSIIQTTDNAHHRSGANHRDSACHKDSALLGAIDSEQGTPAIIAAKPVIERYQEMGIIDRELDDESILWYNNLTGSNSLADESVGVVLNAELNDNEIAWRSALAGDTANRETTATGDDVDGMDLTFDSDIANAELQRFRDGRVAQALFRIGRDDDIDESIVYVNTAAIPDWIPVDDTCEAESLTNSQQDVLSVLMDMDDDAVTKDDIINHEDISLSDRTIRDGLNQLEEWGYVEKDAPPGPHPTEYTANRQSIPNV